mgnify:CR=1 FL=1
MSSCRRCVVFCCVVVVVSSRRCGLVVVHCLWSIVLYYSIVVRWCSLVFVVVRWCCWWWWMCGAAYNSHRLCVVVALVVVTEHCRRSCGPVRQSRCTSRPVSGLSRVYLCSVCASLQTWCMAYLHSPVIPYHWLPSSPSCSSVFRRLCLLCSTRPGCGRPSMALQSSLR